MPLKVRDIMVQNVKTADHKETALKATELMNKHEIGCLVITINGKSVGIVTEKDLLERVLLARKDPSKIRLARIMSKPLVCVSPNVTISKAAQVMIKQRIKKLIVMKHESLVGILSLTDVAAALRKDQTAIRLSLKNAPSNFRKAFEMYDTDSEQRKCPQIVLGGGLINCLGPKCMWFNEGECRGKLH